MSAAPLNRLTPEAARAWLLAHPDALRLDARAADDFERGHIPRSLRLDGRNHEALLMRQPRSRPVFIACYHGHASQVYAQMFIDFGFACVADLVGGRQAWLRDLPEPLQAWLAEAGFADAEARGGHGNTPLMQAAWRGRADIVQHLLQLGVDLSATNGDGNNALWMGCVSGDVALVTALVEAGVDIDHANATGATALMYAASSSKPAVVRTLLALGADAGLRTQDDFTALDMAASLECLQLLRAATPRQAPPTTAAAG
jgi:rhodanese-related sulfurtransferase